MSRKVAGLVILCLACVQVGTAYGQERTGRFWLRANLGFGYQTLSADNVSFFGADAKLTPDPVAGISTVGLGAFLSDRLVLFGEVGGNFMPGPKFEVGDEERQTTEDFTASAIYVGGGVQYYLAPTWFVSGTVGIYRMQWEVENLEARTDPGLGFCLALGKDWPISNKIALGVAGHGLFGFGAKDDEDNSWNSVGFGLSFSFSWVPKGIR